MLHEDFIKNKFGVSLDVFFKILKDSPGADGYILGAIGEQLFKEYAEEEGFEVRRIKEKPRGGNDAKSSDARGDFYIRDKGETEDKWFVVECKSLKSNSEDRFIAMKDLSDFGEKRKKCIEFLEKYSVKRSESIVSNFKSGEREYYKAKGIWEEKNPGNQFPNFQWNKDNPGAGYPDLTELWNNHEEIKAWINNFPDSDFTAEAFYKRKAPIRLLQTHMPSSRKDEILDIKSTGPLKSEFNILCVDLYLRTGEHKFVFANSQDLNRQAKAPNHLQQNYNIDILVEKDNFKLHLSKPWYDNLKQCIRETSPTPRKMDKTQLDDR